MKSIGGFFELELPNIMFNYHSGALALSTGRACMLTALEQLKPARVYLPYYCCDAMFEPMLKLNIDYQYYGVDERLEPYGLPKVEQGELLIIANMFGVQSTLVRNYVNKLGLSVLVDNTHDFFCHGYQGASLSFTSARKYFGVPDGAYLYSPFEYQGAKLKRFEKATATHNIERLLGQTNQAYIDFRRHEDSLGCDINRISILSERLLSLVNYDKVKEARRQNFNYLLGRFAKFNRLTLKDCHDSTPFCYPLVPDKIIERSALSAQNIYIPYYWRDVKRRKVEGFPFEKDLSMRLLPLPIDHRYNLNDMEYMADEILRLLGVGR